MSFPIALPRFYFFPKVTLLKYSSTQLRVRLSAADTAESRTFPRFPEKTYRFTVVSPLTLQAIYTSPTGFSSVPPSGLRCR